MALFVYALFDLIATPSERARYLPKPLWFVVLLLVPDRSAAVARASAGCGRCPARGPTETATTAQPPPGPRGPDDDPDYLRSL